MDAMDTIEIVSDSICDPYFYLNYLNVHIRKKKIGPDKIKKYTP